MKRQRGSPEPQLDLYLSPRQKRRESVLFDEKNDVSHSRVLPESSSYHVAELPALLDLTSLNTETEISHRFADIAAALFHRYCLSLRGGGNESEYEILEIEFYLQKSGCHEDPFTHGSEEQKQSGLWYFHRAPRKSNNSPAPPTSVGGYRGGTRKGVDLTIGIPSAQTSRYFPGSGSPTADGSPSLIRGGVLLRTMRRMADSKVISGPSLLVDEILRASGASSIAELVAVKWNGDISAFPPPTSDSKSISNAAHLYLKPRQHSPDCDEVTIYRSPRIGLDLSHPDIPASQPLSHPRVVYVSRPYRYFVQPHLLTANGRGQTFLGVYQACVDTGLHTDETRLCAELVKLTGLKATAVSKNLADYNAGLASGDLKAYIGVSGKGASASPKSFLRMMGILKRLQSIKDAKCP